MRAVIKVENNLLEILKFLEYNGYKWASGHKPTDGINWSSKIILIDGKSLRCKSIPTYEPDAITFEQFRNQIDMKTSNILPGHKLVLENGNVFVVREYKNTKIVFPEGCSRSVLSLDELCDENLTPKSGTSCIMKILNALNMPIWERKFTRSEIKTGFTITNENDVNYIIIGSKDGLRIVCTNNYIIGPKLDEIMNEDMTPTDIDYAEIIEVRDREGKVVYSKK